MTFRSLLVWLLIWCSVLSPVQAANLLKMGQIQAWGENHRCHYPINSVDPDGLKDLTYDMKRKVGSFNPRYNHASAGRGIGFVTTYAGFVAGGGARAVNLLIKGGQALRYGAAGATVFASQHGQEVAEMVEGALLPMGHPSIQPFALGLSGVDGADLESFAASQGAKTWKTFSNPDKWKREMTAAFQDSEQQFVFDLTKVDAWAGVTRAAGGRGGATDWELLQIQQNPDWWGRIKWFQDGKSVGNPFE